MPACRRSESCRLAHLIIAMLLPLAGAAAAQTGTPAEDRETREPPPLNHFVDTRRPTVKGAKKAQP